MGSIKNAKDAVGVENLRARGRGMRGTEQGDGISVGSTPNDDKAKGRGRDRVRGRDMGWGPAMTRCDLAPGSGCNRRQDDEQQPLQNSTLGRLDLVFLLHSLDFSDGRGRRGLRSKQRKCLYNDAVWSPNRLTGTATWGLPPSRPAEPKGQDVAARRQLKRLFRRWLSRRCSEDDGSKRWAPRVWISRHTVRTWCHCLRTWMDLRNSLTFCRQRFAFFGWRT